MYLECRMLASRMPYFGISNAVLGGCSMSHSVTSFKGISNAVFSVFWVGVLGLGVPLWFSLIRDTASEIPTASYQYATCLRRQYGSRRLFFVHEEFPVLS